MVSAEPPSSAATVLVRDEELWQAGAARAASMHVMEYTTAVHRGDLVFLNQRGRLFYAKVVGIAAGDRLAIEPLDRTMRVRTAKPAEIVDHWARSHAGDRGPMVGQLSLEGL